MWCLFRLCIQEKGLIQLVIIVLVTKKNGQFTLDQSFQETRLNLLPEKECKKIGLGFLPGRELCAAYKYIRRIDGYKYCPECKKPKASKKCRFCPKFRRIKLEDRKRDKEIKYGSSDSCTGDSGGPLWKWQWKGKKPKATVPSHHVCILFQIPKRQAISTDNGFVFKKIKAM